MKDLFLLVADKNMEFTFRGGLARPASLGIRDITFDIRQHSGRDGGMRTSGAQIANSQRTKYSHALLVLDLEGSGADTSDALTLEEEINARLRGTWGENAGAIVIDPELEAWIWGSDNSLSGIIRWKDPTNIRDWLMKSGFPLHGNGKPYRPKEAFQEILRVCQRPRSSALFQEVASGISLSRCEDAAFLRTRRLLQSWFAEDA